MSRWSEHDSSPRQSKAIRDEDFSHFKALERANKRYTEAFQRHSKGTKYQDQPLFDRFM